jgi:hypothetical protein
MEDSNIDLIESYAYARLVNFKNHFLTNKTMNRKEFFRHFYGFLDEFRTVVDIYYSNPKRLHDDYQIYVDVPDKSIRVLKSTSKYAKMRVMAIAQTFEFDLDIGISEVRLKKIEEYCKDWLREYEDYYHKMDLGNPEKLNTSKIVLKNVFAHLLELYYQDPDLLKEYGIEFEEEDSAVEKMRKVEAQQRLEDLLEKPELFQIALEEGLERTQKELEAA